MTTAVRPLLPRTFSSLSEAEEESGQSRIYLGIHWAFDKTAGIAQGRRIADYVVGGMKLEEGSKVIIDALGASGALLHHSPLKHSYPHCWRHKTPVIFLATPQWFISMEKNGLRKGALRDIPKVKWIPAWG